MATIPNGGAITFAQGFTAAGVGSGLKASGKLDLAIVYSNLPATAAAAFTTNRVVAAPVVLSRRRLESSQVFRAIVINSGNANACTGKAGFQGAEDMLKRLSQAVGVAEEECLVASTGIIGEKLPIEKVLSGIDEAAALLDRGLGREAAKAILTTDAYTKEAVAEVDIDGTTVRIGGMAKGAGMIAPSLVPHATMIGVITTDAAVGSDFLRSVLGAACARSFNSCSVDGDTSTNDTVFVLANGASGAKSVEDASPTAQAAFAQALEGVCVELAKMIVKDGEGSTKLITYSVTGAASDAEAFAAARAMASSLLVKTAFFGQDPNWGRLLAAAGYSGSELDTSRLLLKIGGVELVKNGEPVEANAEAAKKAMGDDEIGVELDLGVGSAEAIFYGCDLPYEYVRINSEYHT